MLKKTIGNGVKGAFTLAEVLITLGIIGVVAAMTMPTLINSTQGAQYKTAYKKALSVMSQAVVMNIALEDYDLSQTLGNRTNGNGNEASHNAESQTLYTLFKNRMNVVKVSPSKGYAGDPGDSDAYIIVDGGAADDIIDSSAANDQGTGGHGGNAGLFNAVLGQTNKKVGDLTATLLFFNDGITFIFDNTQGSCMQATKTEDDKYCYGFIDVNGQKAPNRVVRCDNNSMTGTAGDDDSSCVVSNPTDIYPIAMFDQSIIPASAAARAVLYAK